MNTEMQTTPYISNAQVWAPTQDANLLAVLAMPETAEIQDLEHYQTLMERRLQSMVEKYRQQTQMQSWETLVRGQCAMLSRTEVNIPNQADADLLAAITESPLLENKLNEVVRFPQPVLSDPIQRARAIEAATSLTLEEWLTQLVSLTK